FPMDGGRVLRAVMAMRMGSYARATNVAARIGRLLALVLGTGALFVWKAPFLVLIAIFVWLGAGSEAAAAQTSSTLEGVPIEQLGDLTLDNIGEYIMIKSALREAKA